MYPQGACRIRKPAPAGNGCAIFPTFETAQPGKKIRCSAEADLFRGSLAGKYGKAHCVQCAAAKPFGPAAAPGNGR